MGVSGWRRSAVAGAVLAATQAAAHGIATALVQWPAGT